MATVNITFDTENDAFAQDPGAEIHRLLSKAAYKIGAASTSDNGKLQDSNGISVGHYEVIA